MEHNEWRAKVGPVKKFDTMTAHQFNVMTDLAGLRGHHYMADIGCGCLRGGRLYIPYLEMGHYFGVEPDSELLNAGVMHETGPGVISMKAARFTSRADFDINAEWPSVEWDRILAQSVLTHLDVDGLRFFLDAMDQAVGEDTEVWLTFMAGEDGEVPTGKRGLLWDNDGVNWYGLIELSGPTLRAEADGRGLHLQLQKIKHPNGHTWATLTRR